MIDDFRRFIGDERGVTAIEYGLIAALVAVGAVAAFTALGTQLGTSFTTVSGKLAVPT
jgi:pilus assembly protein Flp/PilA